jgi:hypothetical protein
MGFMSGDEKVVISNDMLKAKVMKIELPPPPY